MVAAAVATQEPRLAATVLVMGGALAHEVIARCPLARSEPARNRAAEGFGWSTEDLERRLEPILAPLDPASYPGRVDPERVLIVEAARDECMTEAGRKALWEAMDRPERISDDDSAQGELASAADLELLSADSDGTIMRSKEAR